MRRILQLSVFGLAALAMGACELDQVVETPTLPVAGIRFLNVVPDTGAMDFRFVDIPENSSHFNAEFRSTADFYYKPAAVGERHLRVFRFGTTAAVASIVVKDTVLTLEEGKLYTVILWGFARPGSNPPLRLTVLEDTPPDPGTQVALRVINACLPGVCGTAATGVVDVIQYVRGTTGTTCPGGATVPATATWAAVPVFGVSNYVQVAPNQICHRVTPAGGGAAAFTDPLALAGSAATVDREAIPGTTVAGSAVVGIIVPRNLVGSQAPSTGGRSSPGVIFNWERRPPRSCSPIC